MTLNLKLLIKSSGLAQFKIAKKLGLHPSGLTRRMNGVSMKRSLNLIDKIADLCGYRVEFVKNE